MSILPKYGWHSVRRARALEFLVQRHRSIATYAPRMPADRQCLARPIKFAENHQYVSLDAYPRWLDTFLFGNPCSSFGSDDGSMNTTSKRSAETEHPRIRIQRAYAGPGPDDGYRVLVDRYWPRGCRKETLQLDEWARELAPGAELIHWFAHDVARWEDFRARYKAELAATASQARMRALLAAAAERPITLVYGASDSQHNQAVVLQEVLLALNHDHTGRRATAHSRD
jgi:uncharacterized protein YeaO (DUF488 family)